MTLKNSFLIDMTENMKRRSWVFWSSFLVFFCYFPGYLLLALNNIRADYKNVTEEAAFLQMQGEMKNVVNVIFQINPIMPFLVAAVAVLLGIQGFVYLHNKRQVDFYHSQPVSRKRRFLVLWVNGMVVFAVAYLSNMLLGMVVAAAFGNMSMGMFLNALKVFAMYALLFLAIYHLAMIAVFLTGNTLVSLLALGVFLGYEIAVRAMKEGLAASFFCTYVGDNVENIFNTWFSPVCSIYKYEAASQVYTYGKTMLELFLQAAMFGIISFWLYGHRKSESHGNSISFSFIKEPVRFLLLSLTGVFGSYLIFFVAGENLLLAVVGTLFLIALMHAVIQLVYEVDFRAISKKWGTALLSFVTAVLIFLSFRYDWMGYDSQIPKQYKVESVSISLLKKSGFSEYNDIYILLDGSEVYRGSYVRNHMRITDLDTIYELLEHRAIVKQEELKERSMAENLASIRIIFQLKNGKKESRILYLNYEENLGLLDEIYHMEEYQTLNNQVMEENFAENYQLAHASYSNGMEEYSVTDRRVKELLEAYKKDVNNSSYKEIYYNLPVGKITFKGIGLKNQEYLNQWQVLIYESYENTMKILKEEGISPKAVYDEEYLDSIVQIRVQLLDKQRYYSNGTVYTSWSDSNKTLIYENRELFPEFVENAVPEENRWWPEGDSIPNEQYTVQLFVKNPHDLDSPYVYEVFYQIGEVPDFIIKDLEGVEYGEEKIIK